MFSGMGVSLHAAAAAFVSDHSCCSCDGSACTRAVLGSCGLQLPGMRQSRKGMHFFITHTTISILQLLPETNLSCQPVVQKPCPRILSSLNTFHSIPIPRPQTQRLWGCRPGPEGVQRERSTGLAVFATALRCVPYIWPDVWSQNSAKLAEDLARAHWLL